MRPLFAILQAMQEDGINFCLQSQGGSTFYNISLEDQKGNYRAYNSKDIDQIEQFVEIHYSDLLDNPAPNRKKRKVKAAPIEPSGFPAPPPFPRPF